MNAYRTKFYLALGLAAMLVGTSATATLLIGDTVVINFTESGNTVGGNWNELVTTLNAPIAAGTLFEDLVTFADGEGTGVSFSITAPVDSFGLGGRNETPVATRAFPVSGTIPDEAQRRLTYHTTAGQQFVFSGLNDGLTYNLSILSANTAGRDAQAWIANPGVNQTSILVDPDDGLVHTFFNLSTNGAGSIILESTAAGGGTSAQHLNAMELTAIPEPGALMLIGLGMGMVFYFRHRRN